MSRLASRIYCNNRRTRHVEHVTEKPKQRTRKESKHVQQYRALERQLEINKQNLEYF